MSPSSSSIVLLIVLHLLLCRAYGARIGVFDIKSPTSNVQHISSEKNNNGNNDITKKDGANKDKLGRGKIEVVCEDEEHCTSKGTLLKRRTSRVAHEYSHHYHDDDHGHHHHHWLPWIYEDYRGPKRHVPRHH